MAAPRLKVGGFDFSPYLRTQPDEGSPADPAGSAYFAPQFSGSPAISEGAAWVGDAVSNRTLTFPVYFTGANRAAIMALVKEANQALVKGAQVEFCIDPDVDSSSFFDLERGVVQQEFNFYHLINGITGAVLTLVARPYAHTATHRLIASIPAASSAVVEFAATGINGDAYALANLEVRVGSAAASQGRVIAWGVHPHPSHNPYRSAAVALAQASSRLVGASGAIGSQYVAIPISPTGASGVAYQAFLDPPSAHIGRHRIIAIGRSGITSGIPMWAEDAFGAVLGPTAVASQTDLNKWQIIDLGEVNVPARASGQESVPTQFVNIYGGGNTGASLSASPGFHLNGIMFLPLDYSAGIMRTLGQQGAAIYDTFSRFPDMLNGGQLLETLPMADSGQSWSKSAGYLGVYNRFGPRLAAVDSEGDGVTGATGFYDLASGVELSDVELKLTHLALNFSNAASAASGAWVECWAKRQPGLPSAGVWARLTMGPSMSAQMFVGDGEKATAIASTAIASSLASAMLGPMSVDVSLRVLGGNANLYIATGVAPSPVLSAGHPAISAKGNPAVRMQAGLATQVTGVNAQRRSLEFAQINLSAFGAGGSDIGPRQWFRFESHPEGRVVQGNASVFMQDRLANYHGQFPKMPPVPTNATGPARVIVLQGEVDNLQGQDGPDIALSVLERFRFLV